MRRSGVSSIMASITDRFRKMWAVIGVSIRWAAMQFTRTPAGPYSTAAIFVAYSTARFAEP